MILDSIFENRKKQIAVLKEQRSFELIENQAHEYAETHKTRDFAAALCKNRLAVVAEVKKASPSKGVICENFDPVSIAKHYEKGGAAAISVLTEESYFQGSGAYLEAIRREVNLPLLRKDFIFDEWQICEARLLGADAILLIAAMLDKNTLKRLREYAENLGLQALVETHNEREVETAKSAGAKIFGVNNRNLNDFNVDLATAERLAKFLPGDAVFVAESGIFTKEHATRMKNIGADAILVGESLMRADSIEDKLNELRVY